MNWPFYYILRFLEISEIKTLKKAKFNKIEIFLNFFQKIKLANLSMNSIKLEYFISKNITKEIALSIFDFQPVFINQNTGYFILSFIY